MLNRLKLVTIVAERLLQRLAITNQVQVDVRALAQEPLQCRD